ncbi:hypothetical protein EMIT043CA1_150091 [Pseudomonas brassicacearum]
MCRPDLSQVFLSRDSLVVCRGFANTSIHFHIRAQVMNLGALLECALKGKGTDLFINQEKQ